MILTTLVQFLLLLPQAHLWSGHLLIPAIYSSKVPLQDISVAKQGVILPLVMSKFEDKSFSFVIIDASHQPMISPAEAAILESMLSGGSHLSLKAHFVDQLPQLNPLLYTLTSLNLSYNSFVVSWCSTCNFHFVHRILLKEVPREVVEIESLIFLSMRNNPLKKIPSSKNNISIEDNVMLSCFFPYRY